MDDINRHRIVASSDTYNKFMYESDYRLVLQLLFNQQITPGKAAEAIAELALGMTPRLPAEDIHAHSRTQEPATIRDQQQQARAGTAQTYNGRSASDLRGVLVEGLPDENHSGIRSGDGLGLSTPSSPGFRPQEGGVTWSGKGEVIVNDHLQMYQDPGNPDHFSSDPFSFIPRN